MSAGDRFKAAAAEVREWNEHDRQRADGGVTPDEVAAIKARYDAATLAYDPFRKRFPSTDAAVACLSDVPALIAAIERLQAALRPFADYDHSPETIGPLCVFCERNEPRDAPEDAPVHHAPDCPVLTARRALGKPDHAAPAPRQSVHLDWTGDGSSIGGPYGRFSIGERGDSPGLHAATPSPGPSPIKP